MSEQNEQSGLGKRASLTLPGGFRGYEVSARDLLSLKDKKIVFEIGETDSGIVLKPVVDRERDHQGAGKSVSSDPTPAVDGETFRPFSTKVIYDPKADSIRVYSDTVKTDEVGKNEPAIGAVVAAFEAKVGLVSASPIKRTPEQNVTLPPALARTKPLGKHPAGVDPQSFADSVERFSKNISALAALTKQLSLLVNEMAGLAGKSTKFFVKLGGAFAAGIATLQLVSGFFSPSPPININQSPAPVHRTVPTSEPPENRLLNRNSKDPGQVKQTSKLIDPEDKPVAIYMQVDNVEGELVDRQPNESLKP